MSPFEHLSVLISIVIGLGIARLLSSLQKLAQEHQQIRFYWLPLLWAALVFTIQVEWWWASFEYRQQVDWNFFYFLFILLSPMCLYLAATFVLPDIKAGLSYDLKDYYFHTRGWLFSLIAVATALDAVRRGLQAGSLADFGTWSNAASSLLVGSLAIVRKEWYHALVSLLLAGVFLSFIISSAIKLA